LDSVFIGPNERQTLLLKFADHSLPPMFLEDVLVEIERFVEDEGPRLLRDGGKISVTNNILPVVKTLKHMIQQAHDPENKRELPDGFKTARVRHSLDDLHDQLGELIKLTKQVEQQVPFPEYDLRIDGVSASSFVDPNNAKNYQATISFFGNAIDYGASVILHSPVPLPTADYTVEYYSAERIDVTLASFDPTNFPLSEGEHELTVVNPDGERATFRFTVEWEEDTSTTPASYSLTVAPINGDYGNSGYSGNAFGQFTVNRRTAASRTAARPSAPQATLAVLPPPAPSVPTTPVVPSPAAAPTLPTPPAASVEDVAALHQKMDQINAGHVSLSQRFDDLISRLFDKKQK
jgi:hypothetical protein